MILTDDEIELWWLGLSEARRQEILQVMVEKAPSEKFCVFAQSLRDQHDRGKRLSPKQLASVKKWDR